MSSLLNSIPWRPLYSQNEDEFLKGSDTLMETYAVAMTILFTVFVYALEQVLDQRQANAYKMKIFPKQLEITVSKIDAEKKNDPTQSKKKEGEDSSKGFDKAQPILPQLQDTFTKSQNYGTDKINFQMFSTFYGLIESVTFLMLGFLPYIWDTSVTLGERYFSLNENENEIKISLIFLLLTSIIGLITSLPFEMVRS